MIEELCQRILDLSGRVGALKYGEFTLASGAPSSYYFDGRLISLHPEGAYYLGKVFLESLGSYDVAAVGGPATAAIPLVTAIALVSHLEGKPIEAFFVRAEAKAYGTGQRVEGRLVQGSRVAVVDDVCTTGSSLFGAIEAVESEGCQVMKILTILDRHQGGSEELRRRGYDFQALLEADAEGTVRVAG
ncbi:MAG: orotate phosphoribosyltransferase [Dehalococcoidia bacterium]|nr:orotate phosphoribosyltransferase [Dehalococcoidia bacterium]